MRTYCNTYRSVAPSLVEPSLPYTRNRPNFIYKWTKASKENYGSSGPVVRHHFPRSIDLRPRYLASFITADALSKFTEGICSE